VFILESVESAQLLFKENSEDRAQGFPPPVASIGRVSVWVVEVNSSESTACGLAGERSKLEYPLLYTLLGNPSNRNVESIAGRKNPMKLLDKSCWNEERGFSLTELMVALVLTMIVMMAVFALLQRGQDSFRREPEVADMNQSARAGLQMISNDLMKAGFQTPNAIAIMWVDGGGINPDELTIIYADEDIPTSEPLSCADSPGPCKTIDRSAALYLPPDSFNPPQTDATQAYGDGMVLFALETDDVCENDGQLSIVPFEVTQPPRWTSAGGSQVVQIIHNSGGSETEMNMPGGFDYQVHPDCAVIGLFHVVQYRINPLPPAPNPVLERRDLGITGGVWTPVSNNIENLQVQYAVGTSDVFQDEPLSPRHDDPATWITRVKVSVFARSESRDLQGATQGVFAAEDRHLRNAFSTTVSLRNQVYAAAVETDNASYN
jgi:type II secretory pathway pseudopilin PulG